jgi:hypothetical protein
MPREEVMKTAFWSEWLRQVEQRKALAEQERELDQRLAKTGEASLLLALLYAELNTLYEHCKAEVRIPKPGGGDRPYIPARFKQAIDRGYRQGTLVTVVARIVRSPTEGLEHLAEAGRPDLMVESAVLDATKPYHHLFTAQTKSDARATMNAYYSRKPRS